MVAFSFAGDASSSAVAAEHYTCSACSGGGPPVRLGGRWKAGRLQRAARRMCGGVAADEAASAGDAEVP